VGAAFGMGAGGYVLKSRLTTDLENAIAAVLSRAQFSSNSLTVENGEVSRVKK
jgi:hypothetical protein